MTPSRMFAWLFFAATIAGNALQTTGENSVGAISDKYNLDVTPAGYTFSIWSVIYIALAALVYGGSFDKTPYLWGASCIFNIGWIFFWTSPSLSNHLIASLVCLIGLSLTLLTLWNRMEDDRSALLLSIYVAWVIGATILNFGVVTKWEAEIEDPWVSQYCAYAISLVQILWQILVVRKAPNTAIRSLAVPLVGIWTGAGIVLNGVDFSFKEGPLWASVFAAAHHLYVLRSN